MEIGVLKAKAAAAAIGHAVIVEDTCLCFNAYKGLPGPYIKWFLTRLGVEGLPKMLEAFEDKSAYAQCTFVFAASESLETSRVTRKVLFVQTLRASRMFLSGGLRGRLWRREARVILDGIRFFSRTATRRRMPRCRRKRRTRLVIATRR